MKRLRANFSQNHLFALLAVWKLINATSDAIAKSQNMPLRRNYWKRYLNDLHMDGFLVSKLIHYTSPSGKGTQKLGEFFALSAKGAEVIAETLGTDPENVFFPHGGIQSKSPFQFPHRALLIQLLAMFLGHQKANPEAFEVLDLLPEYRYIGANRLGNGQKATRVTVSGDFKENALIPDGIIRFRAGETVRLATVEFHRETDTGRIIEQLRKHASAIDQGLFSGMFDQQPANHVLSVYDDSRRLRNVRDRIEAGEFPNFSRYSAGFHFASLDDVFNLGVDKAFYQLTGKKSEIFN
nr:hypothetical protein pM02_c5_09 [uncultured bacterium]